MSSLSSLLPIARPEENPFSPEELESDLFIPFIERSMVNQRAPFRDLGFMSSGQLFDRVFGY